MSARVPCEDCGASGRLECGECFGTGLLAYGRRSGAPYFDEESRCDAWCMEGKIHCPRCDGEGEYTPVDEEAEAA